MNNHKNLKRYGWVILDEKSSDIRAELIDGQKFSLIIDDGEIISNSYIFHVYVENVGKILEGRISTKKEFETIMRVLGFPSIDSYQQISEYKSRIKELELRIEDVMRKIEISNSIIKNRTNEILSLEKELKKFQ